jgi:uncharacterized protein (DUF2235 family)
MKNIVVCCDGTANEFAEDRTNVVKLTYTLQQIPGQQIVFYHPGLGRAASPGLARAVRMVAVGCFMFLPTRVCLKT